MARNNIKIKEKEIVYQRVCFHAREMQTNETNEEAKKVGVWACYLQRAKAPCAGMTGSARPCQCFSG